MKLENDKLKNYYTRLDDTKLPMDVPRTPLDNCILNLFI